MNQNQRFLYLFNGHKLVIINHIQNTLLQLYHIKKEPYVSLDIGFSVPLYGNKYLHYEKRGSRTVGQRPYENEQTLHLRIRGIEKGT